MKEVARILNRIHSEEMIERFLNELLTPAERKRLLLRWKLVKMLHEGKSQRAIAKSLGISLCKITRGSRELKKKNSAFRIILETFYNQ